MMEQPDNAILLEKLENMTQQNREQHKQIYDQLKYMNGTQRTHGKCIQQLQDVKVDKDVYSKDLQKTVVNTSSLSLKLGIIISIICILGSWIGAYIAPKILSLITGG